MITQSLTQAEVPAVVAIHLEAFPGYFMSFLGKRFLTIYYNELAESPYGFGAVCLDNQAGATGTVAAFAVCVASPRYFYQDMLRKKWPMITISVIPALLKKPCILLKLLKGLAYPKKSPAEKNVAILTSIGVSAKFQGAGAGSLLLQAVEKTARERGIKFFSTGAKRSQEKVVSFYLKHGFIIDEDLENPGFGDSVLLTKQLF